MKIILDVCGLSVKSEIETVEQFTSIDFEELGAYEFAIEIDFTNQTTMKFSYWVINSLIQKGFKIKSTSYNKVRFYDDTKK